MSGTKETPNIKPVITNKRHSDDNRKAQESIEAFKAGEPTAFETGGQVVAQAIGSTFDVAMAGLAEATPDAVEKALLATGKFILKAPGVVADVATGEEIGATNEAVMQGLQAGAESFQKFQETNPVAARDLEAAFIIADIIPGVKAAKVTTEAIEQTARKGFKAAGEVAEQTIEKGKKVVGEIAEKVEERGAVKLANKIADKEEKLRKFTTEILQPPKVARPSKGVGLSPAGVTEASKFIKKAKNFKEIDETLKDVAQDSIDKVNKAVAEKAIPLDDSEDFSDFNG